MSKCIQGFWKRLMISIEKSNQAKVERYIRMKYPTSGADVDFWLKQYFYNDKR